MKKGDTFLSLLFNFVLGYDIRRVRVNQDCLKLQGTHQFLFNAYDFILLGGSLHTIEKNTEIMLIAFKEIGQKRLMIKLSI